ncbi:hypothetical protein [Rhizobium sp. Leaf262]|uniref:hypothetical protein n=1 Tax=Rhizobium sp. Leaf262 TaxID=1736312 RepID=UPI000715FCCE|nr:hypothetical protein [Rhizobium sp. Leaf262]KQO83571.1 hypothetical protein ASF29_01785 [Rhizobium sp. Leaf262]
MLTPVSPVSAVDVSFATPTPRQDAVTSPTTPAPTTIREQHGAVTNLASNTGIRAVSGELQLSNNAGVLAETLGKLLNIARMDGEAADAYVARLVESIKTFPADQKATLEKALGSIMRGITLDILAAALKSSAGPEAARLAVMFELSRSGPAGRQTKPSIPAYLQDILPESPVLAQIKPTPQISAGTADKVLTALPQRMSTAPSDADGIKFGTLPLQPSVSEPQVDNGTLPLTPKPATGMAPAATTNSAQTGLAAQADMTEKLPSPDTRHAQSATTGGGQTPQNSATSLPVTSHAATVTPLPPAPQHMDEADVPRLQPQLLTPLIEGPSKSAISNAFSKASPKEMENLLLAVLLDRLPESADVKSTLAAAPLPAMAGEELEHPVKSQTPQVPVSQAKSDPGDGNPDDIPSSQRPDIVAAQKAAIVHDVKAAILEQPTLQAAVAAMIAKEGTALPFIAYPMAKDEDESDTPPRGRLPSSEGGSEDSENGSDDEDQDPPKEERTAANDEAIDHSLSEGANDDNSLGNAESYYLKMSGFS